MAFWNITTPGQVTTFDANGNALGTDIDQGSIRHAGNIAETTKFTNVTLGEPNPIITVVNGTAGVTGANVAGTFNGGDQVIVRVTNDIAGIANTVLVGGDSNSAASPAINQCAEIEVKLYKTAIRNGDWNPTTAPWGGTPVTVSGLGGWSIADSADQSSTLVANATDNAANPTQAVPGELVYHYGSGAQPTQDEYEAKNLW